MKKNNIHIYLLIGMSLEYITGLYNVECNTCALITWILVTWFTIRVMR